MNEEIQNLLSKEKFARAQTEIERKKMYEFFLNAPAAIYILSGPDHVFEFTNIAAQHFLKVKGDIVGKRVKDVFPEMLSQGIITTLDEVYQSGKPFDVKEMPVVIELEKKGELKQGYYNYTMHPLKAVQKKTTS